MNDSENKPQPTIRERNLPLPGCREVKTVLMPAAGTERIPAIDFHSPEFNRTDDLNDHYPVCDFESLEGVVTADMRHRQQGCVAGDNAGSQPAPAAGEFSGPAEDEPIGGLTWVTMMSQGRVLILDTDPVRAGHCRKTLAGRQMTPTVLITDARVPAVRVTGAFCGFTADVIAGIDIRSLTTPPENCKAVFDLVLDLQPVLSFACGRPVAGYFAPGSDQAALDAALGEMPRLRGQFRKPQYVVFQPPDCLHGRSCRRDCHRCLDICPVGAIESSGRQLLFNHALCQGCGACALVCPVEAILIMRPEADGWQTKFLHAFAPGGSGPPPRHMLISEASAEQTGYAGSGETDEIHVPVESIADVRIDMLLAALDGGVRDVQVIYDLQTPAGVIGAVEDQIRMMRTVLRELGLSEDFIRSGISGPQPPFGPEMPFQTESMLPPLSPFPSGEDRRAWIRLAIEDLCIRQGRRPSELALPPGAPFGAITVNADSCTLCMACVTACPFSALSSGAGTLRLSFCEADCRQCGLCMDACPERAIGLLPRFLCQADQAHAVRVLHEAEPFSCLECGVPFAPAAMVARMQEKLRNHWMYSNDRQIRRLSLCRTCRTRDALLFEEGSPWKKKE